MSDTSLPLDAPPPATDPAPSRWWAWPAFVVLLCGMQWPLMAVTDWAYGVRPAPTVGLLAGKALFGVVQGLIVNWLVSRGRRAPAAQTPPRAL